MNKVLTIGCAFLLSLSLLIAVQADQSVYRNLRGRDLQRILQRDFSPLTQASYKEAREALFSYVSNDGGSVELVYTGQRYKTCSIPDHNIVNTEHTWPQSKFRGSSVVKADLHHLYPTWNRVNNERGNKAFAEIPDSRTRSWWASVSPEESSPVNSRERYSESTDHAFEPPEEHKGNVARALFYVYTVHRNRDLDLAWFRPQVSTLVKWHRADPVDAEERERDQRIADFQGNHNPFVLYPDLVQALFLR